MLKQKDLEQDLKTLRAELNKLSREIGDATRLIDIDPDRLNVAELEGLYSRLVIYLQRYKTLHSVLHGSKNMPHLEELGMDMDSFHKFKSYQKMRN